MRSNLIRAEEKNRELINTAKEAIVQYWSDIGFEASAGDDSQVACQIIDNMIYIIPPEEEPIRFQFITITEGGKGRGRSIKPGNIILNMRKLFTAVAASGLAISASIAVPWTTPFAAIVIWDAVWSNLKAELSEREAAIIWTMWLNCDENNCLPHAGLLEMVNFKFTTYGRLMINQQELDDSLEILRRMGCIKRSKSDASLWWLCEWVKVNFK